MNKLHFECHCPFCDGEGGYNIGEGDQHVDERCDKCNGTGTFKTTLDQEEIISFIAEQVAIDNQEAIKLIDNL